VSVQASSARGPFGAVAFAWDRLSNMRFALWILLALALGSILGIYVGEEFPTNVANWELKAAEKAGPALYSVLDFFQMFDPFRSWWYRSIVGLLSLSLTACAIKRFKGSYRRALFFTWFGRSRYYDRYDDRLNFMVRSDDPLAAVRRTLKRSLFSVRTKPAPDGGLMLSGNRFGISRLGPFMSHIGLLFLVIGGLGGVLFGLKTMLWMAPGDTARVIEVQKRGEWVDHQMPFEVRLDDFRLDLNERGQVSQYVASVQVTPDGGEPYETDVMVNHPLRQSGYSFYQASYQTAFDEVKWMDVVVEGPDGPADPVRTAMGERFPIPGTDLEAVAERFWGHAVIADGDIRHGSRSHSNPAFRFGIYRGEERIGDQLVFLAHRGSLFGSWRERTLAVRDYGELFYTGFEVSRSPLTTLIWIGLLVSSIGLMLSFMVDHRQAWALAEPVEEGVWRVHVAAVTNKAPTLYAADFRRWADAWKENPDVSQMKVHLYRS